MVVIDSIAGTSQLYCLSSCSDEVLMAIGCDCTTVQDNTPFSGRQSFSVVSVRFFLKSQTLVRYNN